jgi:hypothetical protein
MPQHSKEEEAEKASTTADEPGSEMRGSPDPDMRGRASQGAPEEGPPPRERPDPQQPTENDAADGCHSSQRQRSSHPTNHKDNCQNGAIDAVIQRERPSKRKKRHHGVFHTLGDRKQWFGCPFGGSFGGSFAGLGGPTAAEEAEAICEEPTEPVRKAPRC